MVRGDRSRWAVCGSAYGRRLTDRAAGDERERDQIDADHGEEPVLEQDPPGQRVVERMDGEALPRVPGEGQDDRDVLAPLVEVGDHPESPEGDRARGQESGEQREAFALGGKPEAAVAAQQGDDKDRTELDDVRQVVRLEDEEEQGEERAEGGGIAQEAVQRTLAPHPSRKIDEAAGEDEGAHGDRKSTRLNSSHLGISY